MSSSVFSNYMLKCTFSIGKVSKYELNETISIERFPITGVGNANDFANMLMSYVRDC